MSGAVPPHQYAYLACTGTAKALVYICLLFQKLLVGWTQTQCLMFSHINLHKTVRISAERRCVHPVVIVLLSPWNEWNGNKEAAKAVDELFANLNRRSRWTHATFCDIASCPRWLSALYDSGRQWRVLRYGEFSATVPPKLWKLIYVLKLERKLVQLLPGSYCFV